jgi:hypothetical protein
MLDRLKTIGKMMLMRLKRNLGFFRSIGDLKCEFACDLYCVFKSFITVLLRVAQLSWGSLSGVEFYLVRPVIWLVCP